MRALNCITWSIILTVSHYHSSLWKSGFVFSCCISSPCLWPPTAFPSPPPPSLSIWVILMNRWVEEKKNGHARLLRCYNSVNQSPPPSLTSYPFSIPSCPFLFCLLISACCPSRHLSSILMFSFSPEGVVGQSSDQGPVLTLTHDKNFTFFRSTTISKNSNIIRVFSVLWRMQWTDYNQGRPRLLRSDKT